MDIIPTTVSERAVHQLLLHLIVDKTTSTVERVPDHVLLTLDVLVTFATEKIQQELRRRGAVSLAVKSE